MDLTEIIRVLLKLCRGRPDDDASGGPNLFADGSAGREYADAV